MTSSSVPGSSASTTASLKAKHNSFFLSVAAADWSLENFEDFVGKSRRSALYYYKACLNSIVRKQEPFTTLSDKDIATAEKELDSHKALAQVTRLRKRLFAKVPPRVQVRLSGHANLSGGNVLSGGGVDIGGSIISAPPSSTAATADTTSTLSEENESVSEPVIDSVENHAQEGGSLPRINLQLPSGTDLHAIFESSPNKEPLNLLNDCIMFPFDPQLLDILPTGDLTYLKSTIPHFPDAPEKFSLFLKDHEDFLSSYKLEQLPTCRPGLTGEESDVWTYIHIAVIHFRRHYEQLNVLSLSHAEGWSDVNIWAWLIDKAFLYSSVLSLNRKEVQSNVNTSPTTIAIATAPPNYDGIVHNLSRVNRIDIGFVEVKPARVPYPKESTRDRQKVVVAMRLALLLIRERIRSGEAMSKVVVVGIICNGLTMRVLQAWMPFPAEGKEVGDVVFMKENVFELKLETLGLVLETCWRVKVALENTYMLCKEMHGAPVNERL